MAKKKVVHKFEVDYDGMGSRVDATVKLHGVQVCTITAMTADTNQDTIFLIKLIEQFYKTLE